MFGLNLGKGLSAAASQLHQLALEGTSDPEETDQDLADALRQSDDYSAKNAAAALAAVERDSIDDFRRDRAVRVLRSLSLGTAIEPPDPARSALYADEQHLLGLGDDEALAVLGAREPRLLPAVLELERSFRSDQPPMDTIELSRALNRVNDALAGIVGPSASGGDALVASPVADMVAQTAISGRLGLHPTE